MKNLQPAFNTYLKHSLAATLLLALCSLLVLSPAYTDDAKPEGLKNLTAAEIETLLAGNTAVGKWAGTNYRQYFSEDGSTIYAQEGSRSTTGSWRVNRSKDLYESIWQRTDWTGYPVASDGEKYFWISHSLPPQAFEMVPGQQLVAPEKNE